MDKYAVYHYIKVVQDIVKQYTAGRVVAQELADILRELSTRNYRVAVIGEFKRGKSSLVNSILGTEILPTDILPTTAVVNRVVYGTEQKIEIFYKDGSVQTTTVEELSEYATKKDEQRAGMIREIVVHYPSVFCQNNIELIDTPGLNDDEFMDKTTLEVLDEIDTAIVTTHAEYPISETEKKLICRLIEQEDIYHLTFVATFIDRVSDEAEEQDRVVELIRRRLSQETYEMFRDRHSGDPELMKKAERILCDPVVFAVSSRMAMRGFVNGDKRMLDESRFPHFKYELSALLTANQEEDLLMKGIRLMRVAIKEYDGWHKAQMKELREGLEKEKVTLQTAQSYQRIGCMGLTNRMIETDKALAACGIVFEARDYEKSVYYLAMARAIAHHLLGIPLFQLQDTGQDEWTQVVSDTIKRAVDDVVCDENQRAVKTGIHNCMALANDCLRASQIQCGLGEQRLSGRLDQWEESVGFPKLDDCTDGIIGLFNPHETKVHLQKDDLLGLVAWIQRTVIHQEMDMFGRYQEKIKEYLASWRSVLLKQNIEDKEEMGRIAEQSAANIRRMRQQLESLKLNYEDNLRVLAETEQELSKAM